MLKVSCLGLAEPGTDFFALAVTQSSAVKQYPGVMVLPLQKCIILPLAPSCSELQHK